MSRPDDLCPGCLRRPIGSATRTRCAACIASLELERFGDPLELERERAPVVTSLTTGGPWYTLTRGKTSGARQGPRDVPGRAHHRGRERPGPGHLGGPLCP